MPKLGPILFLLAVAATLLESSTEDDLSQQDEMNRFAVQNYNQGYENGKKAAAESRKKK